MHRRAPAGEITELGAATEAVGRHQRIDCYPPCRQLWTVDRFIGGGAREIWAFVVAHTSGHVLGRYARLPEAEPRWC